MANDRINEYLQHTLREDFTSPNPEVRKAAIYALGRLGTGPEVLVVLRNVAAGDEDPEVRYTAKKALNYWEGVLGDTRTDESTRLELKWPDGSLNSVKLAEALSSPRPGHQIAALIEAARIGDAAGLAPIRQLVAREQDPWVIAMAVKALGSLGDPTDVQTLAGFLGHKNQRVVANAIEALEMLGDPELPARLTGFLGSEDNRVRANAVKAIFPHEPDRAFRALEDMARNQRPWMRASAIYCLKVLDDPRCEPLLLEMLEREYATDLVKELLEALVAQGTESAVGTLGALAEASEGDRQKSLRTAWDLLLQRLGTRLDRAHSLVDETKRRRHEAQSQRSGMFTVPDLEEEAPDDAPEAGRDGSAGGPGDPPSPVPMPEAPVGPTAKARRPSKPRAPGARPSRPATAVEPGPGYQLRVEEAGTDHDPGSRQAIAVALVLALLAGAYGIYRMVWNPPRLPGIAEVNHE